ncbi:MAG: class F sortase [Marmoricola sp.]
MSGPDTKGGSEELPGSSDPLGFVRALPALVPLPRTARGRAALAVGAIAAAAGAAALRPRLQAAERPAVAPQPPAPEVVAAPAPRRAPLVFAVILVIAVLAVPWAIPGFAHRVGEWLAPSAGPQPVRVADPSVLPQPTASPTAGPSLAGPLAAAGKPNHLIVPRLQVNAPVVPIAVTSGALIPPSDPLMIGWWKEGPVPGADQGTAILTGHTVHYGGGAFDHLSSLVVGDHFKVRTARGVITYTVLRVRGYTKGSLARYATRLFRVTGPPRVLLVTCANWNGSIFLDNTVVTGAPISDTVS